MSIETSENDALDDDRSIEVSSIQAIYPEITLEEASPTSFKLHLEIPVSPLEPQKVVFRRSSLDINDGGDTMPENYAMISHFPSLRLSIELPKGYPSSRPPTFHILDSQPAWLPVRRKEELVADGRRIWEECGRDMVLFAYIDYLQQESYQLFSLSSEDSPLAFPLDMQAFLLDYDSKEQRRKFEQETFNCEVCLEPKKGSVCHRLSRCSHVFCKACLQDFYTACITEGDIASVKCLSAGCAKELAKLQDNDPVKRQRDANLSPSELLQIPLGKDLVERYVSLKRKNKLETDKRTVYCPREWCQGAARSKHHPKVNDLISDCTYLFEKHDDEDTQFVPFDPKGPDDQLPPMSERVAVCEDCDYAFCIVCRKGWHGEAALCSPQREAELSAAEKANQEYIEKYTSPCPTCSSRAQKSMGCNHMICFKCGTHFCYLCSSWLDQQNPYKHFNDVRSSCHMRLWELEAGDIPVEDGENGPGVNTVPFEG
ncbi:RING finger protein [Ascosphaera apis ARSEF 7405]|uniref:RBR-type E3 ubiquitin transferase n=1 Tax=Ascosphaera apis ARSEF 7405 TaxID=392613 RepID=A0A167Z7J9_9EURO|nr:RING finger protein [Ascosphaera apis ARSEF 7405]